jgi:hypothetical protein
MGDEQSTDSGAASPEPTAVPEPPPIIIPRSDNVEYKEGSQGSRRETGSQQINEVKRD